MATVTLTCGSGDLYGNDVFFSATETSIGFGGGGAGEAGYKAWVPFVAAIPKGAVVASATLKLVASTSKSGTTCNAKFGCEAADNPTAPANWAQLNARTLTTAYTASTVGAWTAGTEYTFDIKTAVQEILNRAGWVSGNTLAVLIQDNSSSTGADRLFASSENTSYAEAKLDINYSMPGGGQIFWWG